MTQGFVVRTHIGTSGSRHESANLIAGNGQDMRMTRDELLVALAAYAGDAQHVCLETLSDQRSSMRLSDAGIHTTDLLTIYKRRATHVKSIGLPTIGFDDAVRQLQDTPYDNLRLASCEAPTGHPYCVLFMAPDSIEIVAALAVTGPMPPT